MREKVPQGGCKHKQHVKNKLNAKTELKNQKKLAMKIKTRLDMILY